MNNQVYKCERCGKLYAMSDWAKHENEIVYNLTIRKSDVYHLRDGDHVDLCDECSMELTDWMNREKTRNAPEKKEEAINYNELICNALVRELIERGMRMNRAES